MTPDRIWQKPIDLASIAATGQGTAVEHLGIEVHTILANGLGHGHGQARAPGPQHARVGH